MECAAEPLISQLNLKHKKLSKSHQKIADYIEKHYGSDEGMLAVAEKYYDFGIKVLNTMPPLIVKHVSMTSKIHDEDDDE